MIFAEDLEGDLSALAEAAANNPLRGWRPTPVQLLYLRCRDQRFQLRGGNQLGKTEVQAVATLERMLGPDYAYHVPADLCTGGPEWQGWLVCTSWKQSLVVMSKVWDMLPKDQLHPGSAYTRRRGFTGQSFQTRNGAMLTFVTTKQDDDELASATLNWIGIDEPPPESKWGELSARVRHHGAQIGLTYTPINRPVGWVRKKVEAGEIVDFHAPLTLANCWPIGADRPFETQERLDQFAADVPAWQHAQRIGGDWEGPTVDRWIPDYDESLHMRIETPPAGASIAVGIDYGIAPGKMAAVLVVVLGGYTSSPQVWFLDEEVAPPDTAWDLETLAKRIKAMLERNGWDWRAVDSWIGDRSAETRDRSVRMENRKTHAALATIYGVSYSNFPKIDQPKKGENSVVMGCTAINSLFKRNRAAVHPRCVRFRAFLSHFNGDPRDKVKDAGDAGRYGLMANVRAEAWQSFLARY